MKTSNGIKKAMLACLIVLAVGFLGWLIMSDGAEAAKVVFKRNVVFRASCGAASSPTLPDASRNASYTSGAATCYDADSIEPCPVADFPNQDAEYTHSNNSSTCDMDYTDNNNGTITDNCTGLMWQKCSYGETYNAGACDDAPATGTWTLALQYCDTLEIPNGTTDWRLPNVKELQSIVDYATSSPAVAHSAPSIPYFLDTFSSYYWSSTSDVGTPASAWPVSFTTGRVYSYGKTSPWYARCVRGL